MPSVVTWRCSCGRRYRAQFDKADNVSKTAFQCPYCEHTEKGPFSGAAIQVQDEIGKWLSIGPQTGINEGSR
jgi:hypothetical protein